MRRFKNDRIYEAIARTFVLAALVGAPLAVSLARNAGMAAGSNQNRPVEIHAVMPEAGGWMPDHVTVQAGEPLHLRLVSDDVMHGFAIGQSDMPPIDMKPGEVVETTLVFDRPGKYTFYCTRWCGPNHWRMRGIIEVTGEEESRTERKPPLFETLGIDIDSRPPAAVVPASPPSAAGGKALLEDVPETYLASDYYLASSPAEAWQSLRAEPSLDDLSDQDIWNLVAAIWRSNISSQAIERGRRLFSENCAACHGEGGAGDGVMAARAAQEHADPSDLHGLQAPADFTDPQQMLGASSALLQGKIIRGGMGTGMPYWGPVFTEQDTWDLTAFLWAIQFEFDRGGFK